MYRGENIDITIKGDTEFNLDSQDFVVLIYPDRHPDETKIVTKLECEKVANNHYKAVIGYAETKEMPLGYYTVEVLIIENNNSRSIYAKQGAFPMYDSASKSIE